MKRIKQNKVVETRIILHGHCNDRANRTPSEKINIEIDIFQRTVVFSSDFTMWI